MVAHGGLGEEDGVLLLHLDAQEGLLQVGVAAHLHRHLAPLVLAVDEQQVQDEVRAHQRVDAAVAVQDLLEVDGAAPLTGVAVHQLHHLGEKGTSECVCVCVPYLHDSVVQ